MRSSGRLLGTRDARLENLSDFSIENTLLKTALGVVSDHAPPECDRDRIAQVLGDFPASCKTIEDELDGEAAHAAAAEGARDEELRHAVVDGGFAGRRAATRHHGESHGLGAAQDDECIDGGVAEPARELVGFAVADFAQRSGAEHAGVQRRKIVEVIAVDAFDPLAIAGVAAGITDTDCHAFPPEKTKPGQNVVRSARAVMSLLAREDLIEFD